jgi:acetyl esterase/lipase
MREDRLDGFEGVRIVPDAPSGTGVLVLAGSSGRIDADRARLLAGQGVVAESIRWFGGPGQHDGPWEIPVETFLERVRELARDCDRVILLGTSFGAEAALLTGSLSDRVDAVAAFAPSDVIWAGVTPDGRMTSHWTVGGAPTPYVPLVDDREPDTDPPAFLDLYLASRDRFPERVQEAAIPVERIPRLVLVAGGDDRVWPSALHAEAIRARRAEHGLKTAILTDPAAGHRTVLPGEPVATGGIRMQRGGTEAADRRLGELAWSQLLDLL